MLKLLIFSEVSITEEGKETGSVGAGRWRLTALLPLPPPLPLLLLLPEPDPPAEGPPVVDKGEETEGVTDRAALVET